MCDRYAKKECKGIAGSKKVCKKAQPILTLRKLFGRRYHAVKKSAAAKNRQRYELTQILFVAIQSVRNRFATYAFFVSGIFHQRDHLLIKAYLRICDEVPMLRLMLLK